MGDAMPFDLKNLNAGARFYWDDTRTEWVEIRTLSVNEMKRIRKDAVKKGVEYYRDKRGGKVHRIEYEDMNDDKFSDSMWDYVIVNWNILDKAGKKIPCTRENKLLLMGNSIEFAKFVSDNLAKLTEDERIIEEQDIKNLPTTQSD